LKGFEVEGVDFVDLGIFNANVPEQLVEDGLVTVSGWCLGIVVGGAGSTGSDSTVHQPVHSSVVWAWLSSRLSRSDACVDADDSERSRAMAVMLLALSLSRNKTRGSGDRQKCRKYLSKYV
jgi:hypothetical protein